MAPVVNATGANGDVEGTSGVAFGVVAVGFGGSGTGAVAWPWATLVFTDFLLSFIIFFALPAVFVKPLLDDKFGFLFLFMLLVAGVLTGESCGFKV